jgi:hypothetical protein
MSFKDFNGDSYQKGAKTKNAQSRKEYGRTVGLGLWRKTGGRRQTIEEEVRRHRWIEQEETANPAGPSKHRSEGKGRQRKTIFSKRIHHSDENSCAWKDFAVKKIT